jgi:large subunit ribosomal protein L13
MVSKWHLLDAKKYNLGRLATQAAQLLMGKHRPGFVKYQDNGDYVIIINSNQIKVTGRKNQQKTYTSFSGYPSGLKTITLEEMKAKKPKFVITHAIKGMLPKNKLQKHILNRLKIFTNDQHPYKILTPVTSSGNNRTTTNPNINTTP